MQKGKQALGFAIVNNSAAEIAVELESFIELLIGSTGFVNVLTGNIIIKHSRLAFPSKSFQIFELKN